MTYRPLAVPGAWEITPKQHGDPRGVFLEYFQGAPFRDAVGHSFEVQQANCSVSAAGVLRGVHYADVPPGQAKYVTCAKGAVLDVVVDLRVGSPAFGQWDSVLLDDVDRRAIYLSEGLGHAFMSLEDDSTVLYLCSTPYAPGREHGVHPLDPRIGIDWPTTARDGSPLTPQLSEKDLAAPTLDEALASGALPVHADVLRYVEGLA
ncbi:DTDP-4-dehydrorhamnose 3,5-epimerase RmlC [Cellulomonas hominis]|uniref:dTDP-4-dehydrorhamnose 3,5-epimerase n=1 Tax=Cellulomonas hominis TaxID=156981 RepID=A0A511F7E4_9CELL|nr:dTDP-4-dehydrorhamnose 3,5-epimerase [Cellulomonas hominis]MBB5474015.1 dTDP-4-dehydrorhamnose 3,5-epimerase [Cellulomonas hominis]NKY07770.1 dTDP-4-keto-6-deoxy-D-glucose epimerase [Cellulomonas hominis]GEL45190.1 DTDP-4-dehydrorhamnose 3,5-epimerase RmlC [Cellulomonas hominis]